MSVFVDELRSARDGAAWRWSSACHLYADGADELHAFAVAIGLNRSWFQDRPRFPHYDLTERMRARAVAAGATEQTCREVAEWLRARRAKPARRVDASVVAALALAATIPTDYWRGT